MSFNKKHFLSAIISLAMIASLCSCTSSGTGIQNSDSGSETATLNSSGSSSVSSDKASAQKTSTSSSDSSSDDSMFTSRDKDVGYDEAASTAITLSDNGTQCSDKSVSVSGNTMTITAEGTYILSGKLSNGQIIVDADKADKIQLVLNGVSINCDTSAAIYVKQADKVFVTLAENTENTLSNTSEFKAIDDNDIDAVVFSKDDLTFNGSGKLTVNAKYGHGIVSKDDLVFTGGVYSITAQNHAISGKDSVRTANGTFNLKAGKDGIHSENSEDTTKGFVYIENGTFKINADGDGIDASLTIDIRGGSFDITSGGGSSNAEKKSEQMFGRGFGMQNSAQESSSDSESTSAKGIKASGNVTVSGGQLDINSADDAVHSNSNVSISDGTFSIKTGDDGIHADSNTAISGGTISITESYEGIEGQSIDISGGNITLKASDDGLNAAGGNDESGFGGNMKQDMFAVDNNAYIKISGGKLIVNADGDGVDSNGNLYVSGGETYVSGPTNNGNGALDYNGEAQITGGTFIAAGASGMAQNFGSSSTQGSIMINTQSGSGGEIILKDSSGNVIASYTPDKSYNSVVVSCPGIKKDSTYTLTANGTDTTVEMTDIIYGSSDGMGGGMPGGNMNDSGMDGGGMPGGNMNDSGMDRKRMNSNETDSSNTTELNLSNSISV